MGGLELAMGMQQSLASGVLSNYANPVLNPGENVANLDAAGTAIELQGVAVNASNEASGINTYA
jgi:hypothetical protein